MTIKNDAPIDIKIEFSFKATAGDFASKEDLFKAARLMKQATDLLRSLEQHITSTTGIDTPEPSYSLSMGVPSEVADELDM